MSARFCARCDHELPDGADTCPECGVSAEPTGSLGELAIHARLNAGRAAMHAARDEALAAADAAHAALARGDRAALLAAHAATVEAAERAASHGSPKITAEVQAAVARAQAALEAGN